MSRKGKVMIVGMMMGLTLNSCSRKDTLNTSTTVMVTATSSDVLESRKQDTEQSTKDRNLAMMSDKLIPAGCSSENGYYVILNHESHLNLMYVDYRTKQQIYLCDKSDCKHDNEKCNSYIDSKYGLNENTLLCDENKLYFISSESNSAGSSTTTILGIGGDGQIQSDTPTCIYKMDMDGSNRSLLAKLDTGEIFDEHFFMDEDNLYAIKLTNTKVKTGNNSSYTAGDNYQLIGISKKSGEQKKIGDWNQDSTIMGCYKDQLVLQKTVFDHSLSSEERRDTDKYSKAFKKAKIQIVSYDMSTKKEEKLLEHASDKEYYYKVYENKIFYYLYKGKEIRSYDLDTKQDTQFLSTNVCCIEGIYNGYLITSDFSEQKKLYNVSIKDKKIEKSNMLRDNGYPVEIIGETEQAFFVQSNCKLKNEYVDWAGVSQTVESDREYAMITKSDYFENKKNFDKVSMLEEELR